MTPSDRLAGVKDQMLSAALLAGRSVSDITLIGVAKGQPPAAVVALADAGLRAVGVNFLQEGLAQQTALKVGREDAPDHPLDWHFIGSIQSNKAAAIARAFGCVHSLDRLKVAERLAGVPRAAPLDVLIEVNLDDESSKSGVAAEAIETFARGVATLPGLRLRGVMAIPRPAASIDVARRGFARVRELRDRLAASLAGEFPALRLDWLSMGMSADFGAAIREGATHVRVGTALFGPRQPTAAATVAVGLRG